MSSARVHATAGFAAGALIAAVDQHVKGNGNPLAVLAGGGIGSVATGLPDVLEPAIHSHHRQFFHSIVYAALVGKLTYDAYHWEPTTDGDKILRWLALIVGTAYSAHLLLDFGTPRGLPILGK